MIKIAFCDDDISVLNELRALLDKYRVERNQKIEYTSFNSPLELLSEVEKALLEQYGYTKVRFTIHFWLCEINQGNQRVKLATPSGTEVDRWSFDNTPPGWGTYERSFVTDISNFGDTMNFQTIWIAHGNGDDDWELGGTTITLELFTS